MLPKSRSFVKGGRTLGGGLEAVILNATIIKRFQNTPIVLTQINYWSKAHTWQGNLHGTQPYLKGKYPGRHLAQTVVFCGFVVQSRQLYMLQSGFCPQIIVSLIVLLGINILPSGQDEQFLGCPVQFKQLGSHKKHWLLRPS
jgi:hypothetical protein